MFKYLSLILESKTSAAYNELMNAATKRWERLTGDSMPDEERRRFSLKIGEHIRAGVEDEIRRGARRDALIDYKSIARRHKKKLGYLPKEHEGVSGLIAPPPSTTHSRVSGTNRFLRDTTKYFRDRESR